MEMGRDRDVYVNWCAPPEQPPPQAALPLPRGVVQTFRAAPASWDLIDLATRGACFEVLAVLPDNELRKLSFFQDLEGAYKTRDWQTVSPHAAAEWLLAHGMFLAAGIPQDVKQIIAKMEL
jgi:hypothetical protein